MNRSIRFGLLCLVWLLAYTQPSAAAEKPADTASVLGRWIMLGIHNKNGAKKTEPPSIKLEIIFRADQTLESRKSGPNDKDALVEKGTYRIEKGKFFVHMEGQDEEEPVPAVIRDGNLILLPNDGVFIEIIFTRVPEASNTPPPGK